MFAILLVDVLTILFNNIIRIKVLVPPLLSFLINNINTDVGIYIPLVRCHVVG